MIVGTHGSVHEAEFTSLRSLRQHAVLERPPEICNIFIVKKIFGHSNVKRMEAHLRFPKGYLEAIFKNTQKQKD